MFGDQRPEGSEKDQLGNCRCQSAPLEDALLIVLGVARNAFSLNESGTSRGQEPASSEVVDTGAPWPAR